jgi:hypothetical protein
LALQKKNEQELARLNAEMEAKLGRLIRFKERLLAAGEQDLKTIFGTSKEYEDFEARVEAQVNDLRARLEIAHSRRLVEIHTRYFRQSANLMQTWRAEQEEREALIKAQHRQPAPPTTQPAPPSSQAVDISGRWLTDGGVAIVFTQQGERITVSCQYMHKGKPVAWTGQGTVKGNRVEYRYRHSQYPPDWEAEGTHIFTVSPDGRGMTGEWVAASGKFRGSMVLRRAQ